ncbi:MAG: M48 family metallopeptidase [Rikenellaceae bacterium]
MATRVVKVGKQTILHPELGEVILNHSLRARRISITVTGGGEVRLNIPAGGDVRMAMEFLNGYVDKIITSRERLKKRSDERQEKIDDRLRPATEQEAKSLHYLARLYLPQRTRELAKELNFHITNVSVRAAKSRWGSCSTAKSISLNTFLMALPDHLIDFVIIHELCHTKHHDHSAAFHALVDKCVGGREKELNKELKTYHIGYVAKDR